MNYILMTLFFINSLFAISDTAINRHSESNFKLIKNKNNIFDTIKFGTNEQIIQKITKLKTLNMTDSKKQTLLHYAVIYRKYNLAKFLLKKGVKPYLQDAAGDTPLHLAVKNKDIAFIRLFLLSPATSFALFIKNTKGLTPLDIALIHNNQNILSIFESFFQDSDFDSDFLINKQKKKSKYHFTKKQNKNNHNFTQIKNAKSKGNVQININSTKDPSLLH